MTMKRYPNCVHKLFYEPLIITPSRHASLCKVLEARMSGQMPDMPADTDPDEQEEMTEYNGTAVIPVHGVITNHADDIPASSCGCGLDDLCAMIAAAEDDPGITTVIFDFRTPGGGVTGTPEAAARIGNMSKKTIGFTDDECCSAGYWLMSQCQYAYCTPSSTIGSIGVWCAYLDISRQMQNEGQTMQAISAGKYKLIGAYWKPLTDEEKAGLQAEVDGIHSDFKSAVLARREIADEYMQGQTFNGERACEAGLCDGLVDNIGELLD